MSEKEIYLAGGCYWGVEKYVSQIKGVISTRVGFANGNTTDPTYEQVKCGNTGHAETVKVVYDSRKLPLKVLLKLFYMIIDPTLQDQQGGDIGHQYRTGIYYTSDEDAAVVQNSLQELQQQTEGTVLVEACLLQHFYDAEEYHQNYLDKNPGGYCHVPFEAIRWVAGIEPMEIED
ncbi:MAG: peptide-methionine (S)-S-oxide reductase MsrA [Lachnospiraceae bacterium]|nr:peptide-methionine (S)-S-oxide reductase MsrA [Lachnospiraceae bacterium]